MAFPGGSPPTYITVHPTQVYESLIMLGVFTILWKFRKSLPHVGMLSSLGFVLIGMERFFIEFIRVTTPSIIPGLSMAQLMSLAILAAGLIKIIQIQRNSNPLGLDFSVKSEKS